MSARSHGGYVLRWDGLVLGAGHLPGTATPGGTEIETIEQGRESSTNLDSLYEPHENDRAGAMLSKDATHRMAGSAKPGRAAPLLIASTA